MLLEFDNDDLSLVSPIENLPSNVRPAVLANLRAKGYTDTVDKIDLLSEVQNFLQLNGIVFNGGWLDDKPYGQLSVINGQKKVTLYLVTDYTAFNSKTISAKQIRSLHQAVIDRGERAIWIKRFEWEDERKRTVLQSLILHALGMTKRKIHGRKTYAEQVESVSLKSFFNKSSFYGFRNASLAACLRDQDTGEILMAMSFGHPYYGQQKYPPGTVECIRAATLPRTSVQGGMSKLMKFIIATFDLSSILYYVDDAHYDSKSMAELGFKFAHFSGNASHNVFVKTGKMFMRMPSAHHEVMYLMKLGEIVAVPDVGNSTFIWSKQ